MFKKLQKIWKKKLVNDVDTNVAQLKHSNNKCHTSAFIDMYRLEAKMYRQSLPF